MDDVVELFNSQPPLRILIVVSTTTIIYVCMYVCDVM